MILIVLIERKMVVCTISEKIEVMGEVDAWVRNPNLGLSLSDLPDCRELTYFTFVCIKKISDNLIS